MGANAQTSVPAFTAGQVLTAAQVTQINTGIPVFASSTERDAAFGGTGEKTLAEGQYAFLEDVNETQVYDGAAWNTIGGGGLVFISRTTIGSAVSSVTVSGAFSTDYDAYKIIVNGGTASANGTFTLKMGATTAGYKYQQIYGTYSATIAGLGSGSAAAWAYAGSHLTVGLQANIDVQQPFLTNRTFYRTYAPFTSSAGWVGGYLDDATSYTAFTLATSTGTITGGTIDVYGYAKA